MQRGSWPEDDLQIVEAETDSGTLSAHYLTRLNESLFEEHSHGLREKKWPTWMVAHDRRKSAWEKLLSRDNEETFFSTASRMMRKHFGLNIWTSHFSARLPSGSTAELLSGPPGRDSWSDERTVSTSFAYLTLPGSYEVWQRAEERADREYSSHLDTEAGMPLRILSEGPPSEESLKRFPRALKKLGLKAFTESPTDWLYTSRDQLDAADEEDVGDQSAARPQLMMLLRNKK